MMQHAKPFLMFTGQAEEAINLYTSLFEDGAILEITHKTGDDAGQVQLARFRLAGLEVMAIDSPDVHEFTFTPSWSFFIDVGAADIERLHDALSEGGTTIMPLDAYEFSARFTWVQDRFGVSWQLNVPFAQED